MRVLFFPSGCLPFHGKSLDERPLGGIETGVIRLSQALSRLGVEVTVVSELENPPLTEPLYVPHRSLGFLDEFDAVIAVRDWRPLFLPIKARRRIFLTGDAFDQPHSLGVGDFRVQNRIDAFFTVSQWQFETMARQSGFKREKMVVLGNGIDPTLFEGVEERHPKRLIYSSTPYRGLEYLVPIFEQIRKRHGDAELHVFSGYDVYQGNSPYDPRLVDQFKTISSRLSALPGVTMHGNVTQAILAREFMKSSILAYPNTFAETSCITAMEAQAGGCVPVSTRLGALPETIGDSGILIDGHPRENAYQAAFVEVISKLFDDAALIDQYRRRGLKKAQADFSWNTVAKRAIAAIEAIRPSDA